MQYLRNGGRANITEEERERRRLARLAAANNVSRGRNQARQAPLVAPTAPQQPASGPSGRNVGRAGVSRSDPFVQQYPNMPDIGPAPSGPGAVPTYDQPPVPGSDEAILQGSSQAVEEQEAYSPGGAGRGGAPIEQLSEEQIGMAYDAGDPRAIAYAENQDRQYQTDEALRQAQLQQAATAPDAPGAPFINSRVQSLQDQMTNLGVPPESQGVGVQTNPASDPGIPNMAAPDMPLGPDDVGAVAGIDTEAPTPQEATDAVDPDRDDPRGKDQRNEPKAASPDEQRAGIKNAQAASEEQAPTVSESEREDIVTKGQEMGKRMTTPEKQKVAGTIRETFGDLFDKKELARMGVLMLGAMATGMSPGQALAFAGTQYLNRLDAKQANYDQVAASGKYTKQSVAEYKKTGDPNVLAAVGEAPKRTGNFVTKYDNKTGKQVQLEEVKIGDSTYLADANGNIRSGFDFSADPSTIRGSKEYRTRVKEATGGIEKQLKEMREEFDIYDEEKGAASTDILPTTNANKVAQWAVDNGVSPDQLGGLVSSAYQDAINDKRQDGSRARDLVPYLQQLVVRQKVGGNASAFHAKSQPKDGPPRFVNPRKMQALNHKAYEWLASKGKTGGVEDLSNLVYTAALEDWNGLAKADRDTWNDGADDDINGFYDYVTHRLTLGDL